MALSKSPSSVNFVNFTNSFLISLYWKSNIPYCPFQTSREILICPSPNQATCSGVSTACSARIDDALPSSSSIIMLSSPSSVQLQPQHLPRAVFKLRQSIRRCVCLAHLHEGLVDTISYNDEANISVYITLRIQSRPLDEPGEIRWWQVTHLLYLFAPVGSREEELQNPWPSKETQITLAVLEVLWANTDV